MTAVHKVARLTDEIATAQDARSLTELARALGFPKSTVADLCASLEEQRLLQRVEDGGYRLGVRFVEIIDDLLQQTGLVQLFGSQVRSSAIPSSRTVFLSMAQDDADVILEVIHGADPLPVTPYPGVRSTYHGCRDASPEAIAAVVDQRDDVTTVESPIARADQTAPPAWITAMLPAEVPAAAVEEVSQALQRLSRTLSIHDRAALVGASNDEA